MRAPIAHTTRPAGRGRGRCWASGRPKPPFANEASNSTLRWRQHERNARQCSAPLICDIWCSATSEAMLQSPHDVQGRAPSRLQGLGTTECEPLPATNPLPLPEQSSQNVRRSPPPHSRGDGHQMTPPHPPTGDYALGPKPDLSTSIPLEQEEPSSSAGLGPWTLRAGAGQGVRGGGG